MLRWVVLPALRLLPLSIQTGHCLVRVTPGSTALKPGEITSDARYCVGLAIKGAMVNSSYVFRVTVSAVLKRQARPSGMDSYPDGQILEPGRTLIERSRRRQVRAVLD